MEIVAAIIICTVVIVVVLMWLSSSRVPLEKYWKEQEEVQRLQREVNYEQERYSFLQEKYWDLSRELNKAKEEWPEAKELFKRCTYKLAEEHKVNERSIRDVRLENNSLIFTAGEHGPFGL